MTDSVQKPRVVLVDDHPPLLRRASRLLLTEFDVVAALPDGTTLLDSVAHHKPDVIVLDIALPGLSGLNLAYRLHDAGCRARLVFLTVHCDADYARAALAAGAQAYVVKSRMASDLIKALHQVLAGGRFVSPCEELEGVGLE